MSFTALGALEKEAVGSERVAVEIFAGARDDDAESSAAFGCV
jgi:hypothetical protein